MDRFFEKKAIFRYVSLFMIIVLLVGGFPENVYAENSLYIEVLLQNDTTGEFADIVMEQFYVYNLVSGEKYYFTEKEYDQLWTVKAYYPDGIMIGIKSDRGEVVYTGMEIGSVGLYCRLTAMNVRTEDGLVDTVYTFGFGARSENSIKKPVRDGYEIVGWLDEAGDEITFPIESGYFFYNDVRTIYPLWALDNHEYTGREEIVIHPTCTEEGVKKVYCYESGCTRYIEEPIAMLDHDYYTVWDFDNNYHYHLCKNCGIHEEDIAHIMGQWKEKEPASFNEDGSEERKCESCDYSEERRIPKLSESHIHNYTGLEVIEKESNCIEEGLKKVYCIEVECGEYVEEPIEKSGHNYNAEWEYDETNHYHICEVCKCHQSDLIHKMGQWVEVTPPKFREDGLEQRQCTICDYVQQRSISKLIESHVHDYTGVEEVIDAPTCTEEGLKKVYCNEDECSGYVEVAMDKVPHDFDSQWGYDDIYHYHTCEVCGVHEEDILHEMGEWSEVKAATFTKDGLEERKCKSCEYKEERRIPKLSENHIHDYTGREDIIEDATCIKEGLKKVHCAESDCGEYIEDTIERKAHDYKMVWEYDNEYHYHTCKSCGVHDEDMLHEMGQWIEVKAAAFKEDGLEERKCTSCEYKEERRIPKLSESHIHNYAGKEEIIEESTCIEEGLKKLYCTELECGASIEVPVMLAEHTYGSEWEYDGEAHYRICEVCGQRSDEHEHQFDEGVIVKEATSNKVGLMEWKCEDCGYTISKEIEYIAPEEPKVPDEEKTKEPEVPKEEETVVPDKPVVEPVVKEEPIVEQTPYTGDISPVQMYATLAMIAGFTYVLSMFTNDLFGMSEEKKEHIIKKLIRWGKGRNVLIRGIAIVLMFFVLVYYHAIGKKLDVNEYDIATSVE